MINDYYWIKNETIAELANKAHEMADILDKLQPVSGVIEAKKKLTECVMWAQATVDDR